MSHNTIRLVFFGTPEFAAPSLERLLAEPAFDVLAVVTQPDKRRGRGSQIIPSPVKVVASASNLPVWQSQNIKRDLETLAKLREIQADIFVVVAYGQILSQEVLDIPRLGCINCHGSILPQYRGAAPIQWSLYHGETQTGITTMLMDAGMDTGPMLLKSYIPITLLDNAQMVAATLSVVGADLLVETLQTLQRQEIQPIPQDPSQATYAPLIRKPDYLLDWFRPAIELHNQIRGFFPNCMALFRGSPLKITATAPLGAAYWPLLPPELQVATDWRDAALNSSSTPGSVVGMVKQVGPVIQTGQGILLLREVQPAGKRSLSGWDFVNGVRLTVGEQLANGQ